MRRDDEGALAVPPHSDEAEHAVIGGVMLDNSHFDAAAALLKADDFYHPAHRAMWSCIAGMVAAGKVADVITVHAQGGHELAYLNAMAESVPSGRNTAVYAGIVRERAQRRELMRIGAELADAAMRGAGDQASAADLIEGAIAKMLALQTGRTALQPQRISALLPEFIDRLQQRSEGKDDAVATGLADVDRLLGGGFRGGELVVIGARPSMGKSALSLAFARSMSSGGVVLVLSMEDSALMLVARQIAASGRINLADIRTPARAPQSMWERVPEAVEHLATLGLYIDDQPALRLADVKRKVAQVRQHAGRIDAVVIDYVQLMEGDGDNRHQSLSAIAAGLKAAAKTFGVPIILLSQLNREADKLNSPPRLEHLRESGGIEEAADIVALLWREHRRKPSEHNKHDAQLEFVKHKNGATDTVRLWFDGATQRFEDWTGDSNGNQ